MRYRKPINPGIIIQRIYYTFTSVPLAILVAIWLVMWDIWSGQYDKNGWTFWKF